MVERASLTKRTVDALKPRVAAYDVFDTSLTGFHVRVHPSGVKSFRLKYKAGHAQKVVSLGKLSGAFTPEQARAKATPLRLEIETGGDPIAAQHARRIAEDEERRRAITIETLIERWLVEGRDANPAKREISWATDASKLRRHIKPLLGQIRVRDLTKGDVEAAQRKIAQGETAADIKTGFRGRARVTGGRGVARSAIVVLSACLSWAVDQEIIGTNPCSRVKKEKPRKIDRFLSAQEAARLLDTIGAMEARHARRTAEAEGKAVEGMSNNEPAGGGELLKVFGDAIRVLLLTGARKAEIQYLKWSEVDFYRGLITLSRERSKTGEKAIVLGSAAAQILSQRPRALVSEDPLRESEYVFPSPKDPSKPAIGLPKAWERVRREAGLQGVRLHDLRHSFASFAAAGGASLHLIGKALGHVQASTTHRYAHLGADPVRDMAESVGRTILAAGATEAPSAEIIKPSRFRAS